MIKRNNTIGNKKRGRKTIRQKLKAIYLPKFDKVSNPLKFISKRSTNLASLNELPQKQKFKKLY